MNIKKCIVILALIPAMFTNCSDDFLNEVNPNNQTPDNYWLTQDNVMKGLAATYNPVRRMTYGYYGGFDGMFHLQMRADDCYPTRGEEATIWAVLSFTNTPEIGQSMWDYLYTGIQIANEFIYNAPKVEDMDEASLCDDVVIMDMEAGLEHLGRGTTESMDQFIVVIEPGARSVQTYKNVKRLADDLGVRQVRVVANKVRNAEDEEFVRSRIPAEDFLGFIHYNTEVMDADRQGKSPYDFSNTVKEEITQIKNIIDQGL